MSLLLVILTNSIALYAAKGDVKGKKGVVLKFNGFNLKGNNSFSLFSKLGIVYKGSFSNLEKSSQNTYSNSLITLQRGNTTFIYPYKFKVNVPLFKAPSPSQR